MKSITVNVSDEGYENLRVIAEVLNTPRWSDKDNTPESVFEELLDGMIEHRDNIENIVIKDRGFDVATKEERQHREDELWELVKNLR